MLFTSAFHLRIFFHQINAAFCDLGCFNWSNYHLIVVAWLLCNGFGLTAIHSISLRSTSFTWNQSIANFYHICSLILSTLSCLHGKIKSFTMQFICCWSWLLLFIHFSFQTTTNFAINGEASIWQTSAICLVQFFESIPINYKNICYWQIKKIYDLLFCMKN